MLVEVEGYRSHNLNLRRAIGKCGLTFYGEVLLGKRMARNMWKYLRLS